MADIVQFPSFAPIPPTSSTGRRLVLPAFAGLRRLLKGWPGTPDLGRLTDQQLADIGLERTEAVPPLKAILAMHRGPWQL